MQTLKTDTRKRILAVSRKLFLKKGFRDTTTRDIAGEADTACVIGMVALTALAEIIRYFCKYGTRKGVRWCFVPFAFSFFCYTAHWWTDTEGSLAAAVEEMPAGYDELMKPVIDNIPMLIMVLLLTIPIAVLAMRLAERVIK